MNTREIIRKAFFNNVKISYGCTEPIAVALSVAVGKKYSKGELKLIQVELDRNTYKNGLEVAIPGTREHGFELSAALSFVCGEPDKNLEVLSKVNEDCISKAKSLIYRVSVTHNDEIELHIKTKIIADNVVEVDISKDHDRVTKIIVDGREIYSIYSNIQNEFSVGDNLKEMSLNELYAYIESPDEDILEVIQKAIELNLEIAKVGIQNPGNFAKSIDDIYAKAVAGGVDERMSGRLLPVMTVAGSGNQGISCVVPVALYGIENNRENQEILKSVLLSILLTIYIKSFTGKLTPICGAGSVASAGVAGAIAYMISKDIEVSKNAVNNLLATLFGMTCDGAKRSCALKASTGTAAAFISAKLALDNNNIPCGEGITAKDVEITVRRIEKLVDTIRPFDKEVIGFIGVCQ